MRVLCLLAVGLSALLSAGCASSHRKKAIQPVIIGAGAAHTAQLVEVKAARASDHVFAIFPSAPGQRKCQIPFEGGLQTAKRVFPGTCQTRVRPGLPATVVFSERWRPCLKGQDCVAGIGLRHHSWLLTMGPLTTADHHYKKPAVKSSHERGDQPPQGY